MSWFSHNFGTGAIRLSYFPEIVKWHKLGPFLQSKESRDDLASIKFSIRDTLSSLLLSNVIEIEDNFAGKEEERVLQKYDLINYLESCSFIKPDSSPEQVLKDSRLDRKRFHALSDTDILALISFRFHYLTKLDSIRLFYAFRKGLARCERIKWDDNISGILEQLNCREGWYELSAEDFQVGINQNLSLFLELKKDKGATSSVAESSVPECSRSIVLKEIEKEYHKKLHEVYKKYNEERVEDHHYYREYKILFRKRAVEAEVAGLSCLRKEIVVSTEQKAKILPRYHLSLKSQPKDQLFEKLFQTKDRSQPKDWLFEKLSQTKDRWVRLGDSIPRLPRLALAGAVLLAALAGVETRSRRGL